jgi:hypothetical protein
VGFGSETLKGTQVHEPQLLAYARQSATVHVAASAGAAASTGPPELPPSPVVAVASAVAASGPAPGGEDEGELLHAATVIHKSTGARRIPLVIIPRG